MNLEAVLNITICNMPTGASIGGRFVRVIGSLMDSDQAISFVISPHEGSEETIEAAITLAQRFRARGFAPVAELECDALSVSHALSIATNGTTGHGCTWDNKPVHYYAGPIVITQIVAKARIPPPSMSWREALEQGDRAQIWAHVRMGISLHDPVEGHGNATPLQVAVAYDHIDAVHILNALGATIDSADRGTTLTLALARGHHDIVKALIAAGEDPVARIKPAVYGGPRKPKTTVHHTQTSESEPLPKSPRIVGTDNSETISQKPRDDASPTPPPNESDCGNHSCGSVEFFSEQEAVWSFPYTRLGAPKLPKRRGDCFVATAVFENADSLYVHHLRRYRDEVMMSAAWGKLLIKAYTNIGPWLARMVSVFPSSRLILRPMLARLSISLFKRLPRT
jgi:hypothetical protein